MSEDKRTDGADVVHLADVAKDLRFPVVAELEAYWQRLRGTRLVPARSEVDPRRIENTLEYAFILERIAPGMARFRLAGMHLNDLMGMEVRGMPLSAFFTPKARKRLGVALEQVFDEPALARLTLSAEPGMGREAIDGRLLLLPMKSDFGDVSRALGCLATLGPIGRPPRRFDLVAEEVEPLAGPEHAGARIVKGWSQPKGPRPVTPAAGDPTLPAGGADRTGPQRGTAPEPGLAEPPAPFATGGRDEDAPAPSEPPALGRTRPVSRPHLYVVKSTD